MLYLHPIAPVLEGCQSLILSLHWEHSTSRKELRVDLFSKKCCLLCFVLLSLMFFYLLVYFPVTHLENTRRTQYGCLSRFQGNQHYWAREMSLFFQLWGAVDCFLESYKEVFLISFHTLTSLETLWWEQPFGKWYLGILTLCTKAAVDMTKEIDPLRMQSCRIMRNAG